MAESETQPGFETALELAKRQAKAGGPVVWIDLPSDEELAVVVRRAEESFARPLGDLEKAIVEAVRKHAQRFRQDPESSVIMGWISGWYARARGD